MADAPKTEGAWSGEFGDRYITARAAKAAEEEEEDETVGVA